MDDELEQTIYNTLFGIHWSGSPVFIHGLDNDPETVERAIKYIAILLAEDMRLFNLSRATI